MSTLFAARTKPLPQSEAHTVSAILEELASPTAVAVSMQEHDELQDLWTVEALYGEAPAAGELNSRITEIGINDPGFAVEQLEQRDWVADTLKDLAPVHAGRFFLYGSHDSERRPAHGIPLLMEAGLAFGTGHHGTTRGCLLALDRLLKSTRPANVLDVGCGTGVLAIAAARAAMCPALASDIDPEAVRVTKANAIANQAANLVHAVTANGLHHPAIRTRAPYDLIFANILARPLISLAPGLSQVIAPGGTLILSGITTDQERWITAIYRNLGFIPHHRIRLGNWSTLVFRTP